MSSFGFFQASILDFCAYQNTAGKKQKKSLEVENKCSCLSSKNLKGLVLFWWKEVSYLDGSCEWGSVVTAVTGWTVSYLENAAPVMNKSSFLGPLNVWNSCFLIFLTLWLPSVTPFVGWASTNIVLKNRNSKAKAIRIIKSVSQIILFLFFVKHKTSFFISW